MNRSCLVFCLAAACCGLVSLTCRKTIDPDVFDQPSVTAGLEVLAEAGDAYTSALAAAGIDSACAAALARLQSDSLVSRAGIAPDSSVWVVYRNGLYAGIFEQTFIRRSMAVSPPQSSTVRASAGGEAVASSVIVAPFTVELPAADLDAIKGMLDTCFGGSAPATKIWRDADVTVSRVREIIAAGPGVLYWTGHGMLVPLDTLGTYTTGLVTAESYDKPGQLAAAVVGEYSQGAKLGTNYVYIAQHDGRFYLVVLPGFVRTHGNFDAEESKPTNQREALVFLDCCHCLNDMSDAFLAAGAEVCWGWDWATEDGFAASLSNRILRLMTDTSTAGEATGKATQEIGSVCPYPWRGRNARFGMRGDSTVMVRAQMRMALGGYEYRGYSVGVSVDDPASASCMAGVTMGTSDYSLAVNFPAKPGVYDCVLQDDATIALTDLGAGKVYFVSKDCRGANGTMIIDRFGEYVSGSFSGLVGYWQPPHDPSSDPPDDTLRIERGFLKFTGRRYGL